MTDTINDAIAAHYTKAKAESDMALIVRRVVAYRAHAAAIAADPDAAATVQLLSDMTDDLGGIIERLNRRDTRDYCRTCQRLLAGTPAEHYNLTDRRAATPDYGVQVIHHNIGTVAGWHDHGIPTPGLDQPAVP